MTGLHPGDSMLHRPVPLHAARPLHRRCAAGLLTFLLLAGLVMVFVQGTVIRAIRLVQPAVLVRLAENRPKPPLMKIPVPLITPRTMEVTPPQVIIAPDPVVPTPPAPAVMMSAPAASPAPGPADPGVDLLAIARAYIIKVHDRLNEKMIYPIFALRMDREGNAVVHILMTKDGTILSESLTKSSGYADLDKEALAVVMRAQPLPAIPSILHMEKLDTNVTIQFQLPGNAPGAFGSRR